MNLQQSVLEKIKFGKDLILSTGKYKLIEGTGKLQRKIKQEIFFLEKIYETNAIKKEHLQCSNLTHFSALVTTLSKIKDCINILKTFQLENRKITIDIVCDKGLTWIKVIARNPKSLSQICLGDTGYGVRSVIDQAQDYLKCAQLYPCFFKTPKIVFVFAHGIDSQTADILKDNGIIVQSETVDNSLEDISKIQNDQTKVIGYSAQDTCEITRVNLDVSAMLAYVSSVTNGSAALYHFPVQVLAQQAEWERERPVKPKLEKLFEGKTLFCCETARKSFFDIVNTVGGPKEKIRANEFFKRITVLPDNATISDIDEAELPSVDQVQFTSETSLELGGKIRQRSLVIFAFGDRIGAITVTSNDGFVRSARQQGINFVVFVHESRALTEQKEQIRGIATFSSTK